MWPSSLLEQLRQLGVTLEADGTDLHFRAPLGALSAELKQRIILHKPEILDALGRRHGAGDAPGRDEPRIERLDGKAVRHRDASAADYAPTTPIPRPRIPSHYSQNPAEPSRPDHFANYANIASHSSGLRCGPGTVGQTANLATGPPLSPPDVGTGRPEVAAGRPDSATWSSSGAGTVDEALREPPLPPAGHAVVKLGDEAFLYEADWSGHPLTGDWIAIDTETARIEGHEIPTLALASASSGQQHALIHPDRLAAFVIAHRDRHIVAFNAAFDFWVVAQYLERIGEGEALECWWAIAEEGRLHDTMLLDALVRLARTGVFPAVRNLGTVAAQFGGLVVNKEDPFRLRYAEIIGRPWDQVEPGFLAYAIGDPIATWRADSTLRPLAVELARAHGVGDDAIARYGPLTETIQVKAAIALAAIIRRGIRVDRAQAATVEAALRGRLEEVVGRLGSDPGAVGLLKLDRDGRLRMTDGGQPSVSRKALQQILVRVAGEVGDAQGTVLEIPTTPKGAVSTSTEEWAELAEHHPFVADWITMAESSKLCQFFAGLQSDVVHPRYTTMVLTGRTSCSQPNIQQIPRRAGFREIFVPSPGRFLLAVDYSFIELRALAAVCEARYGQSTLADVIRAGRDPHAYTAAMLLGVDPDEFLLLQESDPKTFKDRRQQAKALNFGLPGGLGPASLATYARRTYNVAMTIEEATEFRRRMIGEVYPEWDAYLSDDPMATLASRLGTTAEACWAALDWKGDRSPGLARAIQRVVRGDLRRTDGRPYDPRFIAGVWQNLNLLNHSRDLGPVLAARRGSEELCRQLFDSGVATMTGWVRGRVTYAQRRNTPFQHLAAAGGKLALWRLMREGYRVIAFVHDEVLVELPDEGGFVRKEHVDRVVEIMCAEMERVLGGNLPVACEATLSTCWSKDARLIVRDGKVFPWQPGSSAKD